MISKEDNERLVRVGPDAPMGKMMRRYWLPICLSEQIQPNGPPLQVRLLGENFVAFRDAGGQPGMLDELCMHRRASLLLGRVEHGGLRCLYHGWLFGADGTIRETPNHCDARFRERLKAPAYPVREAGGLIWGYVGPKEHEPPFPLYDFFDGPDENRCLFRINIPANYLQLYEGGTDSSHVGILHANMANPTFANRADFVPDDSDYSSVALAATGDNAPALDIENTPYGYQYAAKRTGPTLPDGTPTASVRVTPVILPVGRIIPIREYQFFIYEVPQDDNRTSTFIVAHGPKPFDRDKMKLVLGLKNEQLWNERDHEYVASRANRYGQDLSKMDVTWSGFDGLVPEDASIGVSMGAIVDRHNETLVAADAAVVRLRTRLLDSLRSFEAGDAPIGAGIADFRSIRSLADTNVPEGEMWQNLLPGNMSPVLSMAGT